jgi:hypothetical protein
MQERQAKRAALLLQYLRGRTVFLTITAAFVLSSPVLSETSVSQPEANLTVQERVANVRKQINSPADGAAKRLVQSDEPAMVAQWDNWNNWRNS